MIDDTQPENKVFLSIKDISKRLNVSDNFVYQQCVKGVLEHYALGGSLKKRGAIRCSEEQLQQYLINHHGQKPNRTQVLPTVTNIATVITTASNVSEQLTRLMKKRKPA
ncbi:helix-turn-helix domain-containing protein [Endozoicomonas sp. ONNA1]|uniref:helix-turn-helix domain-containing protein n=1 Tax=Endozoicomonas sp. ONNA1 TaxID=2828740 RepID=UPI002147D96F|nr:helix-turn-helix domain-containing protein [Endozoicomonas sp. ONNA1]